MMNIFFENYRITCATLSFTQLQESVDGLVTCLDDVEARANSLGDLENAERLELLQVWFILHYTCLKSPFEFVFPGVIKWVASQADVRDEPLRTSALEAIKIKNYYLFIKGAVLLCFLSF